MFQTGILLVYYINICYITNYQKYIALHTIVIYDKVIQPIEMCYLQF